MPLSKSSPLGQIGVFAVPILAPSLMFDTPGLKSVRADTHWLSNILLFFVSLGHQCYCFATRVV